MGKLVINNLLNAKILSVFRHLRILMVVLLLSASHFLCAQQFPVQVNTLISPPYSVYLADYAAPSSNALSVSLSLRDLNRNQYQVKLRVTIEGSNGVKIRTVSGYTPPPIILSGGIPEVLTGFDIRNYLNPNNLEFAGISRAEFIRTGKLPEGFYTFNIEVLDYNRNVIVSNIGLANAWIVLNDPPIVNLPFNGEKVRATDPQNVMFSWTPRHTASPNAAFNTEYEFKLVEIYPQGRNPNDAILASNSIYKTTTSATSLNYSITEPLLIPGREYAFRIRAYDLGGKDLFKNNGYSEVYTFKFGDACLMPDNVTADAIDPDRIKIEWEPKEIHTEFNVQYRRKNDNTWYEEKTFSNSLIIPGLAGNTQYEYQVKGYCGTIDGEYSAVNTVQTPETEQNEFVCGSDIPNIDLSREPLQIPLIPTMTIETADFRVSIKEVTQNPDGSYSGKGWAMIPWFELATVRVKFDNIKVNENYRVYEGNMVTVYSQNSRFVADLGDDDQLDEGTTGSDEGDDDEVSDPVDDFFDNYEFEDTIQVDYDITDVEINEDGDIVITYEDENGDTQEEVVPLEEGSGDILVTDSSGDSWAIDENGGVGTSPDNTPDPLEDASQADYVVQFKANPNQSYGFDEKTYNAGQYDQIQVKGEDYTVSWKSIETGRNDYVNAVTEEDNFPLAVGFKSIEGNAATTPASTANQKQVSVTGKEPGHKEEIDAYVTVGSGDDAEEILLGRVNVKTYSKISERVVIVPVNNAQPPGDVALADALNDIYKQAVAEWRVTITEPWSVDQSMITGLTDGVSGMLSSFPYKMREFNQAYRDEVPGFDDNAYYLFLVTGAQANKSGFMPFKRQFGYIFTDELGSSSIENIIAHELGHGAFRLRHTFSPEAFKAQEGSTNNLMDYSNGTELKKYQWDLIHDPESMNGWMQDDSESASIPTLDYKCFNPQDQSHALSSNECYFDRFGNPMLINSQFIPVQFISASDNAGNYPGGVAVIKRINDGALFFPARNEEKYPGYYLRPDLSSNVISIKDRLGNNDIGGIGSCTNSSGAIKVIIDDECSYQIISGSTTIATGDMATDCECHLNDQDTQVTKCDNFTALNEISPYILESASKKLKAQFDKRKNVSTAIRQKDDFTHLFFVGDAVSIDKEKLEIMEEKLFLLKEHTGINMFVAFIDLENNTLYDAETSNRLAQEMIIEAELSEEKIVLVTFPNSNYESILWENPERCLSLGLAQSGGQHVSFQEFSSQGDVFNTILSAYATIKKPYYLDYHFVASDGTMLSMQVTSTTDKVGLPYINNIRLFQSPHKVTLEEARKRISEKLSSIFTTESELQDLKAKLNTYEDEYDPGYDGAYRDVKNKEEYLVRLNNEYIDLKIQYDKDLVTYLQADLQAFESSNIAYWEVKEQEIGKFREGFMRDKQLVKSYIQKNLKNIYWQQLTISLNLNEIEQHHLYAYDAWVPVDQAVYAIIDVASFIPVVSDAADIVGLFYAGIRGDYTNAAFYSAGLAIPIVAGGGALKAADNAYAAIARKLDDGTVEYLVKKTDEILETDVHVFSIIAKSKDEASQILDEAMPHVDQNGIKQLLDKISSAKNAALIFKNISFDDFIKTVADFRNGANADLAKDAYRLWGEDKFDELYDLFRNNNLNNFDGIIYPPNNGFITIETKTINSGNINRYGGFYEKGVFKDKGKFVSPEEVPFEGRALPESAKDKPLQVYEVLKPIPDVKSGNAIPWFNQTGGGTQYLLPESIDDLVEQGFLKRIDPSLISNGKFIDNILEADYQKYLTRKAKEGKQARGRLEWKDVRDYWLNDSPLARGNNFNRKAWDESWYPAWEVRLDNGKFLDGYNPFTKEVISRKATDLEDISEETYRAYLDELINKYAPPRTITTQKVGAIYDQIRNTPIPDDAKLILEIPESNSSFSEIAKFEEIANSKGITLRFRPE